MDIRGQFSAPKPPPDARYLLFPSGTEIPIELPPMSVLPDADEQEAIAKAAALNTPYFPQLRRIILTDINRRIAAWQ